MADMRTPLNRVRGLGSAREGTRHFWHQRLTGIANIPLMIFLIGFIIVYSGAGYDDVYAALANPVIALILGFAVISALYHMRIGMQVVIEDYVHGAGCKLALLIANLFFTLVVSAAALYALVKIAFGG